MAVVANPVGRGIKFPVTFENGGLAWNMPAQPTEADVERAIVSGARFLLTLERGSMFMGRGKGTSAYRLLFENPSEASADMLQREAQEVIRTGLTYATQEQPPVVSYGQADTFVFLTLRPKRATRSRNFKVDIPTRPAGE